MEECLIRTAETCSDKTVFNYVYLSTPVAEYSPYCREHLLAALSTEPTIGQKAKLSISKS